jgi:hypothetical protein
MQLNNLKQYLNQYGLIVIGQEEAKTLMRLAKELKQTKEENHYLKNKKYNFFSRFLGVLFFLAITLGLLFLIKFFIERLI